MGFARAEQLKAFFQNEVPADRIKLLASVIEEKEGVRTNYFQGGRLRWVDVEKEIAEKTVEEMEDRILIRFPFGKAVEEYD